jgi:predicted nucleotide-binding protein (sugar kinase/HSP70/actin superfamily)
MLQNVQDFLEYSLHNGEDQDATVFFQGWACGPCRYGMYAPIQSLVLDRAGYGQRRICSVRLEDAIRRFGLGFVVGLYDGLLAVDALYKMLHSTRPYENEPGASEAAFEKHLDGLMDLLSRQRLDPMAAIRRAHLRPIEDLVRDAAAHFAKIRRSDTRKPRILVAGEFYVRLDDRCNQSVIAKVERAGGEVWMSPATEFFGHSVFKSWEEAVERHETSKTLITWATHVGFRWINVLARREEALIEAASEDLLGNQHEPAPAEIEELSSRYISRHYAGEPPVTVGRTCAFALRGAVDGAIFVAPFGCLPGSMVEAQVNALRADLDIPLVCLYYDDRENPNTDEFIEGLVYQAAQRNARDGGARD